MAFKYEGMQMKGKIFSGLLLVVMSAGASVWGQTESEKFHRLLDEEWAYTMESSPEYATSTGYPGQDHRWSDMSEEAIEVRRSHARDLLTRVEAIDRAALSASDHLNYDLFLRMSRETVEGQAYPSIYKPITQLRGIQQSIASTITRMPRATLGSYEVILSRLEAAPTRIEQEIALMKEGLALGVTPPKIALRDVPDQVQQQIVTDATLSPLYDPFRTLPESISEEDGALLRSAAKEAIVGGVVPAYRKLHTFLVEEYLPKAVESIAATDLPDGDAWYAFNVRTLTTTDATPESIHELGLSEVARIRKEMNAVIRSTGFEGSFEEFLEFLRTDPQFFYEDKEALLQGYRDIAKRIDPGLTKLFGKLPRLPYGVLPIPSYSEKSQTTAYYQPGSPDAGRAGYFYANTYDLKTRPKWEMEALTVHEAVPGHHIQIALAQEMEDVPTFRRYEMYTAFVEGWGLYSESLGSEIGMYKNPYSKFGQLTYEIWRAVRLVVDTGMHSMGWTRQQAIDYFAANSSKPIHDITVEIDRYIVWPGQALAYKLGELKIKELRARAKEALGSRFDIRLFHDAVLENGALPLGVLEEHIDAWIERQSNHM